MNRSLPRRLLCALALFAALEGVTAQVGEPGQSPPTLPDSPPPAPADRRNPNPAEHAKKAPSWPGKNELELRERLETLSRLSPEQLDAALQNWPRYQKMDLGERARLLQRIQEFKERRIGMAKQKARELGLALSDESFRQFTESFWQKRIQAERELWQEMEPRRKALEARINEQLRHEFASSTPVTPAPASPANSLSGAASTGSQSPSSSLASPVLTAPGR